MSTKTYSSSAAALVGNSKDLVNEILSRLPLSSVMLFRLVCKEWCSLTSTQSFIEMYENINQPGPPHCRAAGNNNKSCFVVQYLKYDSRFIYDSEASLESDHFNTLFFNLDDSNNNNNNNTMKVKMKMVRECIDLSSIFSLRGRGGEKIYYQRTNIFHKKRYYHIKLISSYRGFLLFTAKPAAANMSVWALFRRWLTKDDEKEDSALILYNPVTKEQYTVAAPPKTHVYCGFYYHSPTEEYRILYQLLMFDPHNRYQTVTGGVVQFLVFSLQTQLMRVLKLQDSNNSTTTRPVTAAYYYHPDSSTPPVISNGSLHWIVSEDDLHGRLHRHLHIPDCLHTILCFGMESEEFHTMPHPSLSHPCSGRGSNGHRHNMNLLEMEGGVLCLCDGYGSDHHCGKPILEIYVMEDYKKWTWVRRYLVDLSKYIHNDCEYGLYYEALQILQGDQLLLNYHPKIAYRLVLHKYRQTGIFDFVCDEYALYSLNQHKDGRPLLSSSSSSGVVLDDPDQKKKKTQHFQVLIDGYPGDELLGRLRRMIINPVINKMPVRQLQIVNENMVVLTPSLASFQPNRSSTAPGTGTGTGTFFSIRTNSSYIN